MEKPEAEAKECLGQISLLTHTHVYHSPLELLHFLKYNPEVIHVKMQCL